MRKLSSVTAAFKIASFRKARLCKSAGSLRLLPVRHKFSVSESRKLAITNPYYCATVVL